MLICYMSRPNLIINASMIPTIYDISSSVRINLGPFKLCFRNYERIRPLDNNQNNYFYKRIDVIILQYNIMLFNLFLSINMCYLQSSSLAIWMGAKWLNLTSLNSNVCILCRGDNLSITWIKWRTTIHAIYILP